MPLKRYRYRAYPTRGQVRDASRVFGCVRVVWNDALAACEDAYRNGAKKPSRGELSAMLTAAKKTENRAYLAEVSSVPLQQALADLDKAYRNFFDSITGKRKGPRVKPPKFKSRKDHRQTARFTRNASFKVTQTTHGVGFVTLPKIGKIRFELSRRIPLFPTSVTLIKEADGRYYLSFVVDETLPETLNVPDSRPVAGVDVGLTDLAAVIRSDGTRHKITNPRHARTRRVKLARAQRAYSRKKKGSKNQEKARLKVAVQHRKTRETRQHHHRQIALDLVRENQTVIFETLNLRGLGRTRLAKSLSDAALGTLMQYTRDIAEKYGTQVVHIGQYEPTTQTCSVCGTPGGKKPLHVREWTCAECGSTLDRDYNAALNVLLAAGLAESLNACGGSIRLRLAGADPMKQEPTEQTPQA